MSGYYAQKLAGERLNRVYEVAPPRVQQYLQAEIQYVTGKIDTGDIVLELGCGTGRIMPQLSFKAGTVVGIDTSRLSLLMGFVFTSEYSNCLFGEMDAVSLAFKDDIFDIVVCIQNGISAFKVNQRRLIEESVRVTKPGGIVLFSTYSEKFWEHRLRWFQIQSDAGLLGEIDYEKTRNGVIVCKDGFQATTLSSERFLSLTSGLPVRTEIIEVDESSLFCEIKAMK